MVSSRVEAKENDVSLRLGFGRRCKINTFYCFYGTPGNKNQLLIEYIYLNNYLNIYIQIFARTMVMACRVIVIPR